MEENIKNKENLEKTPMTTRKKILIGGLGGITPVLMNLLVIDLELLLMKFTLIALIGYLIRVIILFYMGSLVAFLNKGENDPVKLFQFGIAAPALFTAFINGTNIDVPKISTYPEKAIHDTATDTGDATIYLISIAFAQSPEKAKTFTAPQESAIQQLFRGFFGSKPKNIWFVISGSHLKREDAVKQVNNLRTKGFDAEIYAPYGTNPNYSVVIGAYLLYDEAVKLRQKALNSGLPDDTYLWTFGH